MNFLAHHSVARQSVPDAPASFFVGNLLPDLVSGNGAGNVRQRHFTQPIPQDAPLLQGMRLHLATDRLFHGHPAFAQAHADAKAALLSVKFTTPLRRVFFFAHAFAEVALDGLLMREGTLLADDLYACCAAVDADAVGREAAALLSGDNNVAANIAGRLRLFTADRYLHRYATGAGQAEAMARIASRAGINAFTQPEDRAILAALSDAFTPKMATYRDALLLPPPDFIMIQ